jgi:hypothetical protein
VSTVKKFQIRDIDHLISVLKSYNLTKSMAELNIRRYGYEEHMAYILEQLGFTVTKKDGKINNVSDRVKQQVELFRFIFDTPRDCYVRLLNKKTGSYYTYNVQSLKNEYKLHGILEKSELFKENVDIMFSLNTYNNMYKVNDNTIFSIHLLAVDVDFDKSEMTIDQCLKMLEYEFDNTVPEPNLIEYGHRIRLMYKVECVGATRKSKSLAKKITRKIAKKLKKYGATDQPLTTYARILGSINSRDNSTIQVKILNQYPYQLRDLQNEVLDKPEWFEKVQKEGKKVAVLKNDYGLNLARLRDLEKIQKIRQEGYRELLCFLYRNHCILSGMSKKEAREKMLKFNSNFDVPLKENKVEQDTRNVERHPYRLTNEWILDKLGITQEEEKMLHLETIISEEEKKRRNNEREKERYRKKNPVSKKEKITVLRQKIKSLKEQGFKNKEIAQELDLPIKTLERHITAMRKEGLL